jgi:hypothetical protein
MAAQERLPDIPAVARTNGATRGVAPGSDSGRLSGADPAGGHGEDGDFRRFGRRWHANQLFWHVFNLLAG